jgi:hypothetical protein
MKLTARQTSVLGQAAIELAMDASFEESKHPRDHGKFTSGGSSGGGAKEAPKPGSRAKWGRFTGMVIGTQGEYTKVKFGGTSRMVKTSELESIDK